MFRSHVSLPMGGGGGVLSPTVPRRPPGGERLRPAAKGAGAPLAVGGGRTMDTRRVLVAKLSPSEVFVGATAMDWGTATRKTVAVPLGRALERRFTRAHGGARPSGSGSAGTVCGSSRFEQAFSVVPIPSGRNNRLFASPDGAATASARATNCPDLFPLDITWYTSFWTLKLGVLKTLNSLGVAFAVLVAWSVLACRAELQFGGSTG